MTIACKVWSSVSKYIIIGHSHETLQNNCFLLLICYRKRTPRRAAVQFYNSTEVTSHKCWREKSRSNYIANENDCHYLILKNKGNVVVLFITLFLSLAPRLGAQIPATAGDNSYVSLTLISSA